MKPSRFWPVAAAVLLLGVAASIASYDGAEAAANSTPTLVYLHGVVRASIPYRAPRAGTGQLTVEVLNPEDEVLARTEKRVAVAADKAVWQEDLKLAKAVSPEELVWHRLRYRFTYADGKDSIGSTESISQILRTPVIRIMGQQAYLSGGDAAVRVIVTDSKNEPIAGAGTLRIELAGQKARPLFTGRLNQRGTVEAQFRFPAGLTGNQALHYVVETPIGGTELTQNVRVEDKASILLTTEKPIYQPGQTIHVRALALDRANHQAAATRKLTFEIEDSKGNKVFKKVMQTDQFGIAAADFTLADEVNLGTYHLLAMTEDRISSSEIALNVERYVLPKFKVTVEFSGKAMHGYRPGDRVTGTVRANYFFGKPVDGAPVTLKARAVDAGMYEAASAEGKTDGEGAWRFDFKLPDYFAGRPLSQGAARVLVEATVKDAAAHAETRGEPITVSRSPLLVTAVPEGGTLVPNLENQIFFVTSYADGKPAPATLKVRFPGQAAQTLTTDAGGIAVARFQPGAGNTSADVEAADKEGNTLKQTVPIEARNGGDQILLRTENAVYRAGDRIRLRVFATRKTGSAYVDVVREGQTVLTRDLDLVNGQAELWLTATPEMAGTLDINAYLFGADARPVADHRLAFVQPADELKIEAAADRAGYKPGDEARIRFRVTNGRGEGVQAALGLQVVDEAVFALAEKQPGFAKVFFYLEQEVMKPRYEIHSIGMPEVVEPAAGAVEQRDRAARALFAATEVVRNNRFETEAGRSVPLAKFGEYSARYRQRLLDQIRKAGSSLLACAGTCTVALRDPWDTELKVDHPNWDRQKRYYMVRSAGPDKHFDTGDDMGSIVQVQTVKAAGPPSGGSVEIQMEHERGPFNGMAEVAGSVLDQTGAAVPGAVVKVREAGGAKTRTAQVNGAGQFTIAGLSPGRYEAVVTVGGFETSPRSFAVVARDRAVVAAKLTLAAGKETILVEAAPGPVRFRDGVAGGVVGGVPGGVAGGVIGGIIGGERMELARDAMQFRGQMGQQGAMMPVPLAAPMMAMEKAATNSVTVPRQEEPAPRTRSYFPEALYINPEIVTDGDGRATITIPLADSITTWRMAMMASTTRGALGSATGSIKVFQDFFVDLDLPVTLTQGDRVTIPVAVYNYAAGAGDVDLQLKQEDWFSLVEDAASKKVAVDAGRVGGSQFALEARRIGKFKLTLSARMTGAAKGADIVVREIEVIPNGREQNQVYNGRLESTVNHDVNFPATAIPDAGKVFVRLYPGPLSQVIEGMDAILRMPGGCFEQTSSSTYPNVLALDYMKRTKKLTPEVHAKAEGFIANGYQRLLTFEVPGGGFSWFGQAPANKILTSYGLMEFSDMAKVYDVDARLIERTQMWLAGQQQADGSWKPDTNFINEGATNRFNTDVLRITAYIGWALGNTGYQGPAVEKAKQYVAAHRNGKPDAYTLAVVANFAVDYAKDREFVREAMQSLLEARTEKDGHVWWSAQDTAVYATGESANVETTGLAVQALLKWGGSPAAATKALAYLAAKKDAAGTWGTTQATIMALRALLLSTEKGAADVRGDVEITLNGQTVERLTLTAENNDLLHQFALKGVHANGNNAVAVRFTGKGALAYQVVGRYFVPWTEKPAGEPLSIDVAYDRTTLSQDDIATATATVKNNLRKSANMVMVDLGIPPGFDLLSEDLQAFQEKTAGQKGGKLEKFSLTATQAILYFDAINAGDTVTLRYRLRAKYPIRAKTFQSRVYEYYDPAVSALAAPVQLQVRKK